MTDTKSTAIEAARLRLREAQQKFDRQQRRYAMRATEDKASAKSDAAKAEKALMVELEAELKGSQAALAKLEAV